MSWIDDKIKQIAADASAGATEKALLGGKQLVDYALQQTNGITVTIKIDINAQPVRTATAPTGPDERMTRG